MTFERKEAERIAANVARRNISPRRLLSEEERATIRAENAVRVSIMARVPARGVRGWAASSPPDRVAKQEERSP